MEAVLINIKDLMCKNIVTTVGYKGGHFEKHLCQRLGVWCLNLQHFGGSRYQVAKVCCDYHNFLDNI